MILSKYYITLKIGVPNYNDALYKGPMPEGMVPKCYDNYFEAYVDADRINRHTGFVMRVIKLGNN